jgi:hypothetical protein
MKQSTQAQHKFVDTYIHCKMILQVVHLKFPASNVVWIMWLTLLPVNIIYIYIMIVQHNFNRYIYTSVYLYFTVTSMSITLHRHKTYYNNFYLTILPTHQCRPRYLSWYSDSLLAGRSGIESQWRQDFLHLKTPALGPTQPPIQWVPGLSWG